MIAYETLILSEPGLVSYWRLDEASGSILDSKDSNPGTAAGGITRQVTGLLTNNADTAVRGDGVVGSYINIPYHSNMNTGAQVTVECWLSHESGSTGSLVLGRYVNAFIEYDGGTSYRWYVRDATGSSANDTQIVGYIPDGGSHHVVGVYDAAGRCEFYVDGVSMGLPNRTPNANVLSSTDPFGMFAYYSGADAYKGTIDEVALYNVALTEDQVQLHYRLGSTGNTDLEIIAVEASAIAEAPTSDVTPLNVDIIAVEASAWSEVGNLGVQVYGGLLSGFHEDFGSTLDQWFIKYGDNTIVYEFDGRLVIVPTGGTLGSLQSMAWYTLDSFSVEVAEDDGPAGWSVDVYSDGNSWLDIYRDLPAGNIVFEGGDNSNGWFHTTIPYDAVAHRWLRFRLDGTTMLWETSPDGSDWTTQLSQAAWDDGGSNYYVQLLNSWWADGDGNPHYNAAYFDNVNIFPQDVLVTAAPAEAIASVSVPTISTGTSVTLSAPPADAIASAPSPGVAVSVKTVLEAELQLDQLYSAYLADAQAYTVDLALE